MVRRAVFSWVLALASLSCATVVSDPGPSDGGSVESEEQDGDLASTGGAPAPGGGTVVLGSGGAVSGAGGASSAGGTSVTGSSGGASSAAGGATTVPGAGGGETLPPGQVLFSEDFESGLDQWALNPVAMWQGTTDGTTVLSQSLIASKVSIASAGEVTWGNQVVEARVKALSYNGEGSSDYVALFARVMDADNAYFLALQANGEVKLKKRAGGNEESISSSADMTVMANTWYTLRLVLVGPVITAYVNDQPILTTSDLSIATGGVGVGTKNATAVFDDILVTTPE